jgi:HSP20 family protein
MVLIKSKPDHRMHTGHYPHSFNSLLNSFFEESRIRTENPLDFMPQADILEKENHYEINMSLPGILKEDVKISLDGELLTIAGERKNVQMDDSSKFLKKEISYGKFSRSFTLGKIDAANIDASFNHGILSVSLPKLKEEPAMTIHIK